MTGKSNSKSAILFALIVLALAIRFFYLFHQGFIVDRANFSDDALITFRYAQNLSRGEGFVYNSGEYVIGTTTPLYTVLMTIPASLGVDLMSVSFVLNTIADILAILLIWRMTQQNPLLQLLSVILYLSHPYIVLWSASGMEMSVFLLLGLLTTWLFFSERIGWAGFFAALLLLCRIDGLLLILAVGIISLLKYRSLKPLIKFGFVLTFFYFPWLIFSWLYTGAILPSSVTAKLSVYGYRDINRLQIWRLVNYDFILVLVAMIGCTNLLLRWRSNLKKTYPTSLLALGAWIGINAFLFTLSPTSVAIYGWYRVPQHAVLALLAAWGLALVIQRLVGQRGFSIELFFTKKSVVMSILATIFAIYTLFSLFIKGWEPAPRGTQMHLNIGRWLQKNAQPTDTVMAGNIGFIGYYCRCKILDSNGLVSPDVISIREQHGGSRQELIEVFKPEYLAIENREAREIGEYFIQSQHYILIKKIHFPGTVQSPYSLYMRDSD